MKRVRIYCDERYPDFSLSEARDMGAAEVSDAFWRKYKRVVKSYEDMQKELEKLYK